MPPKPHRVLLDRVSGYADEAAAYMRRRALARRPSPASTTAAGAPTSRRLDERRRALRRRRRLIEVAGKRRSRERASELSTRGRRARPRPALATAATSPRSSPNARRA
jgi:hypothetical protein